MPISIVAITADELRAWMQEWHYDTAAELARDLGVTRGTVARWLAPPPTGRTITRIVWLALKYLEGDGKALRARKRARATIEKKKDELAQAHRARAS